MMDVAARLTPTFNDKSLRALFKICVLFFTSQNFRQTGKVTRIVFMIILVINSV